MDQSYRASTTKSGIEYAEEWAKRESDRRIIYDRVSMEPMRVYFSRVSDPSKWEVGGVNVGHPAIARFLARWLNAALDWWGNW